MEKKKLYSTLTHAGALPFIACASMPYIGVPEIRNIGSFDYIAGTYGLVIVCFLAGAHWGTFLYKRTQSPRNLFISSSVVVIAAWLAFLMNAPALTLFVLILALLYLLFVDFRLKKAGLLTDYYLRMRSNATAIAVVSLAITIAAL